MFNPRNEGSVAWNDKDGSSLDDAVSLPILSGAGASQKIMSSTPEDSKDTYESVPFAEGGEEDGLDLSNLEGLNDLLEVLNQRKSVIEEWIKEPKELDVDDVVFVKASDVKEKLDELKNAIGYQIEAVVQLGSLTDPADGMVYENNLEKAEALEEQIYQRSIHISELLGETLEQYDDFINSEPEEPKTGWWNKEFQETKGVTEPVSEGRFSQVGGSQDESIGFAPPAVEPKEERQRTGWWDTQFREEQGFLEPDDKDFVQKWPPEVSEVTDKTETSEWPTKTWKNVSLEYPEKAGSKVVSVNNVPMGWYPAEEGAPKVVVSERIVPKEGVSDKLQEFKSSVDSLGSVVNDEIYPHFNQSELSDADKREFYLLLEDLKALESVFNRASDEVVRSGEISMTTSKLFEVYQQKILDGVAYYNKLLKNNDLIFNKQGKSEISRDSANDSPYETSLDSEVYPIGPSTLVEGEVVSPDSVVLRSSKVIEGEILESEIDPTYTRTREEWLKAKELHETKHKEYNDAAKAYYDGLNSQGFLGKNWTRLKASFGFKPQLPAEVEAMRENMFAATEEYNKVAKQMIENRTQARKAGKEDVSDKVLERYHRLLARTTLLNTFNSQLDLQRTTTENLAYKGSGILTKHGKVIRFAGAAAIGAATGGVFGAGAALARTLTGAAVSGAATSVVGEWQDRRISKVSAEAAEKYEIEVGSIEALLKRGELSSEELEESYQYLLKIYHKVDTAMQIRIASLLATAIGSGLLVGGAFSEGVDAVTASTSDVPLGAETVSGDEGVATELPVSEESAPIASPEELGDFSATASPESTDVAGSQEASTYTAQEKDNFWNIMEGETKAGKLDYLDHVDESHRQEIIDLTRDQIEKDPNLLKEVGFGERADDLQIGAEVDTAKLNEIAEKIAKENGWYTGEVQADAPSGTEAMPDIKSEVAGSDAPAAISTETAATAISEKIPTQVSPEGIIEYGRTYPGGYLKFEEAFENKFVADIQGPAQSGGLLSFFFGDKPNTTDAFKLFGPYTMEEFDKLKTLETATLAKEFNENGLDMRDYLAWRDKFAEWQEAGLIIYPKDRFEDVARTAFIRSLEQAPKV